MQGALRYVSIAALTLPAVARGETFIADFTDGQNPAGWTYIQNADRIEPYGGNPGWWLHQPEYDTFGPTLECAFGNPTPFTGDYRVRGVTSIGFDLQILGTEGSIEGGGFSAVLLLRNSHGTPFDISDDDWAYFDGPPVPGVGSGWQHYEISIPSRSDEAVPPGWQGGSAGDCANFRPGKSWIDVITNVDRVEILFLRPCRRAIYRYWNVGADNLSITWEPPAAVEDGSWGEVKFLYRD